jgi:UDP-N-acetylglucosamine 4,6-dehydratase
MSIIDLARAIAPECRLDVIGVRPGEKLHETMVPEDDARNTFEYDDCFVIRSFASTGAPSNGNGHAGTNGGKPCPDGFRYSSDNNAHWLTVEELQRLMERHD